jgi:carboxyl-terminal processing protease
VTVIGCSERRSSGGTAVFRNVPSVYGLLVGAYLHRNRIPTDASSFASVDDLIRDLNDPFTYERDVNAIANATQGQFTGAKGFSVATVGTQVYVATVDAGGPAYREGLRRNDIVVAIDGQTVDASSTNLTQLLGSPTNTLDLRRARQPLSLTITAENFTSISVIDSSIDADTHYVSISAFYAATQDPDGPAGELRRVLAAHPQKARWILDLRWNGGGSVTQACEIADLFAPAATIVELADWTGLVSFSCQSISGDPAESTQVAVLLNGSSASASEVLAAALRDLRSAPLVGEQSYGKGVAQIPYDYADDDRQLVLVTHAVTSPSGRSWNEVGLTPDVATTLDPLQLEAGADSQVLAAVTALNTAGGALPARRSLPPRGPVVGPRGLRGIE